jgi:hypothetical protein
MESVLTNETTKIDLKEEAKGIYLIKGITDNGTVTSKKIIIQ